MKAIFSPGGTLYSLLWDSGVWCTYVPVLETPTEARLAPGFTVQLYITTEAINCKIKLLDWGRIEQSRAFQSSLGSVGTLTYGTFCFSDFWNCDRLLLGSNQLVEYKQLTMFERSVHCCSAWPKTIFGSIKTKHVRDKARSKNSWVQAHAVQMNDYLANKISPYNSFMTAHFQGLRKNKQKPEVGTAC